jgi:hypothetical protein
MTNQNMTKKTFSAPVLTKYGKFEELTQGGVQGNRLDGGFPVNTPVQGLTFS